MTADALRALQDRIEIEELLHRYAEMVDRRDWAQMNRIFALEAAIESWPINLHVIGNVIIEIDGDVATSRCYFHSPMGRETEDGQFIITNAGRYLDKLIRTADGWRIVERVCEQTIMQGSLPEGYKIPE